MKKSFNWFVLVLFVLFVLELSRSTIDLMQRGSIMEQAKAKLEKVRSENSSLKTQLSQTESPEFIERQAREKLNMARKDEIVAIVSTNSPILSPTPTPVPKENWEKWMDVFRLSRI